MSGALSHTHTHSPPPHPQYVVGACPPRSASHAQEPRSFSRHTDTSLAPAAPMELSEDSDGAFQSASEDEAPGDVPLTPELIAGLVKQIEFYFSDSNLPTDKKLLKQIRKDPDGYVPVKLFANFRKVRALSKDVTTITAALRHTCNLQLSADGRRVRRVVPVPDYDVSDIQRRTVVVENLPCNPSPTIESVTDMFRFYGRVKLVRICSKESKGKLPSWLTSSCQNLAAQHAYVEFEADEGAILSAAALGCIDGEEPSAGQLQVRRLTACIQEQRERRASRSTNSHGGGSGSTGGSVASRKGSRDVSPSDRRGSGERSVGGARHGSGGGGSHNGNSCGGGSWGSSSGGGGDPHPYQGHHHGSSGGGAAPHHGMYDPFAAGSHHLRRSGGGLPAPRPSSLRGTATTAPMHEAAVAVSRRSCDSALVGVPSNAAPAPPAPPRINVYRPPAKRLSDGSNSSSLQVTPAASIPPSSGGSFTMTASSGNSSGANTPAATPASPLHASATFCAPPPPPPPAPLRPASPPAVAATPAAVAAAVVATRVSAGGKPPAHPVQACSSAADCVAAVTQQQPPHADAQRTSSEAGTAIARAAVSVPRASAGAPKFALGLAPPAAASAAPTGQPSDAAGCEAGAKAPLTLAGRPGAASNNGAGGSALAAATPLGRSGQMVDDVEGFINNILSRPTQRVPPLATPVASTVEKRRGGTEGGHAPPTSAEDAAAAVASILAATLRKQNEDRAAAAAKPASTVAPTAAGAATKPRQMVYITAVASDEHLPSFLKDLASPAAAHAAGGTPVKLIATTAAAAMAMAEPSPMLVTKVMPVVVEEPAAAPSFPHHAAALNAQGSSSRRTSDSSHPTPNMLIARGPDGTRGFASRSKAVANMI